MITGIFFVLTSLLSQEVLGLDFQYPNFNSQRSDLSKVRIVTQNWYTERPNATFQDSELWLTQLYNVSDDSSNLGRVIYADPIDFSSISFFQTSFTFRIITTRPFSGCGSGMAFFISPSIQAPNGSQNNGALGIVNPDSNVNPNFFAVEFDTRQSSNFDDPSASHMGINVNSMVSLSIADSSSGAPFYPELDLYNNYSFIAWIEYNCSSSCLVQVWMTNNTASLTRPAEPCMNLTYNLSTVFNVPVYLGFSATSAPSKQGAEAHIIYSWNFTTVLKNEDRRCWTCRSKNLILLAALSVVFAMFVVACVICVCFWHRKHIREQRPPRNVRLQFALKSVPRYGLPELKKATHGFSNKFKIGEGGFSTVYKGMLPDGSLVAVKKLKEGLRKEAEFSTEINIISKIRHKNLLELQGWCYERGEAMLLYKYMANGSLDKHLFGKRKGSLDREKRLRILAGVASALEYLHGGLGECVLHRDIKAGNVLLSDDFEPMLSDFGLARLISHDQVVSMTGAGTPGYVAPELLYTCRATDKADVYSYGALALEVACGRKTMGTSLEMPLIEWIWDLIENDLDIVGVLDPSIRENMSAQDERRWRCVLHIGLMCYNPLPDNRPNMRQVFQAIHDEILMQLPAKRPHHPFTANNKRQDTIDASSSKSSSKCEPSDYSLTPR